MIIVAVSNLKGGVGKTTTTVNLAHALSQMGVKVLEIDCDPQRNSTPFFSKTMDGYTVQDVIKNPENVGEFITTSEYPNLDVIKGDTSLVGEILEKEESTWLSIVKEKLNNEYDVCLIDTNPDMSSMTASVLVSADILLTPVNMDNYCRDNLALVEEQISFLIENGLIWKVFPMKLDLSRKAQKRAFEDIVGMHVYPFMNHYISRGAVVDNALEKYKPVACHRSTSLVAMEFTELAKELMDIIEEEV